MQEYHDGILLFNLTDSMVWSKAQRDTNGLKQYYQDHKNKYQWGERAEALIVGSKNRPIAQKAKKLIDRKAKWQWLRGIFQNKNMNQIVNDKFEASEINTVTGKYEKGDNQLVDTVQWKNKHTEIISQKDSIYLIYIENILAPDTKNFKAARGQVISDYQNYLENNWIKGLREKYTWNINKEALEEVKKQLQNTSGSLNE